MLVIFPTVVGGFLVDFIVKIWESFITLLVTEMLLLLLTKSTVIVT